MRRNCDVLLVFLESDLWSLSQDGSADQNFNDMAANNGEDSGLPDTIWRAGNGVVCCNFDIELSKNMAGAYDVRRKQWLMSEANLEKEANEAVDSYASHWHHHNPDAGLRPHQENTPARDRSASRPPGSRTGRDGNSDDLSTQSASEARLLAESVTFVPEKGHLLLGIPSRPDGPIVDKMSRTIALALKRSAGHLHTLASRGHGRILPLQRDEHR